MKLGSPLTMNATKALLLGSGELGKEVAIEFQRFGVEVIAVDRYPNAPAMHVAQRHYVVDMLDGDAIAKIVHDEQPDFIVPEIEAIATAKLIELEQQGFNVVPTARAAQLTMDREGIRRLAAETCQLPTSPYQFAQTQTQFEQAVLAIGYPCVVKPVMSSSGKGQSVIRAHHDIASAWNYAQSGGRAGAGRVIVEGFVEFDYEITLLTIRAVDGIHFCAPIGHRQEDGDYRESWQPQQMSPVALGRSQTIAQTIVEELGGYGLFGVELFIKGDNVYFSEISPRPHDTGMVTMISQNLSEFALHVRAILGLPIGHIELYGPSASAVILGNGYSNQLSYHGIENALAIHDTQIRLFGKPEIAGRRRLGVALGRAKTVEDSVKRVKKVITGIIIDYE
ncbi:formate-dependent phosphoribosylglycinamide formyltransferase [Celerinatantimonas yamalensis]|uniref:Formate-dependent phosphoribosylglycinamide formyltransferase n=1 Tax=Celerinatantimonas yamalensis TaxID=559956 RepID=A0ABW9G433_9GAMM